MFSIQFDHIALSFTALQWIKRNFKISQLENFCYDAGYTILIEIWKWLNLLNSLSFIKETLVNDVYIRIWSSSLTFTALQWLKTNFRISKFSRFLLRSVYTIQVKIWKWLKLLNSVASMKKTLVNQVYFRICSFWMTFTFWQWMKRNSTISQFSSFLLKSGYAI